MTEPQIAEPVGPVASSAPPPSIPGHPSDGEVPRQLHGRTLDEKVDLAGSALGSLALVWLAYTKLLPFSGFIGFVVIWFIVFVAIYAMVSSLTERRPVVWDRVASLFVHAGAVLVGLCVGSAVIYVFVKAHRALGHENFWLHDAAGVGPETPLNKGGVLAAMVGTLIELGIAIAICLPLGVATAVYMVEVGGRFARIVRTIVEAMTALPSIVAGLFIYTVFLLDLHETRSGLAASLAISVMILPIIARASDVVLRVVPGGLREASLALGASRWETVWRVVLPTARPGLATALILGVARGVGETSPVLLTSGASNYLNTNPLHEPMNSLPLFVFSDVRSGQANLIDRGFGGAAVLLIVVLTLFIIARVLAGKTVTR